jgi:hypothetical protein
MTRLPERPGERIDRARVVSLEFDHRRRGLLCCPRQCPNSPVAMDGAPAVRSCTEPVQEACGWSTTGLIDVSTFGKLIVSGPDAGDFLDRIHPNRFLQPRCQAPASTTRA